jgi:hypothetical protein
MRSVLRRARISHWRHSVLFLALLAGATWIGLTTATVSAAGSRGRWASAAGLRAERDEGWSTVAKGAIAGQNWAVEAKSDRRGLCLEATILVPMSAEPFGGGQCSKPVVAGGILLVGARPSRGGHPKITVVGGAFSDAIDHVEAEGFDGKVGLLPLRRSDHGVRPGGFAYMGFALKGPFCARRVMTVRRGKVVWSSRWQEFSRTINTHERFDPRRFCAQAGGKPLAQVIKRPQA